jgi:hypothetical protein
MPIFAGRELEVTASYAAGVSDFRMYRVPGSLRQMRTVASWRMRSKYIIEAAGHRVQNEPAAEVPLEVLQRESSIG